LTVANFAGAEKNNQTADSLRQIILAHYYAISENRLGQAMHYYHSQSPELYETRTMIEQGLSQFLQKTTTMCFCYLGQQDEVATAKHRYLRIAGIKFMEHSVKVTYQLRKEHGNWKIWSQRDNSNANIKLMCCSQAGSIL
jgi:hypothetical protein